VSVIEGTQCAEVVLRDAHQEVRVAGGGSVMSLGALGSASLREASFLRAQSSTSTPSRPPTVNAGNATSPG